MDDGNWDKFKLSDIYNCVNDMFEFYAMYNRRRK